MYDLFCEFSFIIARKQFYLGGYLIMALLSVISLSCHTDILYRKMD